MDIISLWDGRDLSTSLRCSHLPKVEPSPGQTRSMPHLPISAGTSVVPSRASLSPDYLRILLMGPPLGFSAPCLDMGIPLAHPFQFALCRTLCPGSLAAACLPHPFFRQASTRETTTFRRSRTLVLGYHLLTSQLGSLHPSVLGDRATSSKACWPLLIRFPFLFLPQPPCAP